MGNWAGLIIIGIAAFLVISGIQGSWAKFFPWIMSNTSSSGPTPPASPTSPKTNGACPKGYIPNPLARNPNAACVWDGVTQV